MRRRVRAARLIAVSLIAIALQGMPSTVDATEADTTAPTLISFAVSTAGQTVGPGTSILATFTADEPISTMIFGFTDSVGRSYQIRTAAGAGAVTGPITNAWANGLVRLSVIDMFDGSSNRTTYFPGSVSYTPSGATGPTTNPFNLADGNFTVAGSTADTTAPTLISFAVSTAGQTVGPGTSILATFTADEPISTMIFGFTDSVGRSYQIRTAAGAGAVTGPITNAWANGLVRLSVIDMFDGSSNRTTYFPGSVSYTPSGATGPTTNPFNLADGNFTVAGSTADTTAPTLISFAVSTAGQTVGPGTSILATFTADEPISTMIFGFTDSVGRSYQIRTAAGAGAVTGPITNAWANGLVRLSVIDMFDGSSNRTTYFPGSVSYTPSGATGPTTNPFNLADGNFTVARLPGPPRLVSAAARYASAVVSWDGPADTGGSPVTSFRVVGSPGGHEAIVGAESRETLILGLENGVSYSFVVYTRNAIGESVPSSASASVVPAVQPPSPVMGVTATGEDRSARVGWTPPADDGGAPVIVYTVTASPGGHTATVPGDTTAAIVVGLTNGTAYTFTVTASNEAGESVPSEDSNEVTPASTPDAPTQVSAVGGDKAAHVTWNVPADNGSPILSFTVATAPGGSTITVAADQSGVTVGELTNGVEYTFTVLATNAIGDSQVSAPSNSVVPADKTLPSATLTPPATPTSAASLSYTLAFSEPVTGLAASDLTLAGTAAGCAVGTPSGSGSSYTVEVTGCGEGTVVLTLTAGSVSDGAGNPGPAADVGSAAVTIDRTAPSTPASLGATPRTGTALSGTAVPLTLAWKAAADAVSGVAAYELERSTSGGTWTAAGTYAGTSASVTAASSGTVRYRVRAVDKADNRGGWAYTATLSPRLTQQSSTSVRFGGTWTTTKSSSYSGGSVKYAKTKGRTATYTFTGRSIALVTTKSPSRGKVKVYVNGVYQGTVDTYRSSTQYRALAWQKTWSTSAKRTIKLVVSGTSGRPRVDLDAFVVVK